MTLYTKRAFAKDVHQWGKCVVKYLFDVYRDLTNILMTFLIEVFFHLLISRQLIFHPFHFSSKHVPFQTIFLTIPSIFFLSQIKIEFHDGGLNLIVYVFNNASSIQHKTGDLFDKITLQKFTIFWPKNLLLDWNIIKNQSWFFLKTIFGFSKKSFLFFKNNFCFSKKKFFVF